MALEGSLAEGFGNPSSDIDFLFLGRCEDDLPTMPSLLFVDGRRVEIRTRSVRQIADQFRAVEEGAERPGRLSEDLLNRCQRLLHSHPLRGHALVEEVKAMLPAERFGRITADWWAHRARQSLRQAIALVCLDESDEAVGWTRAGLLQTVKSWAAARGETYLEPKWLSLQLDRAGHPDVRDRYWQLDTTAPAPGAAFAPGAAAVSGSVPALGGASASDAAAGPGSVPASGAAPAPSPTPVPDTAAPEPGTVTAPSASPPPGAAPAPRSVPASRGVPAVAAAPAPGGVPAAGAAAEPDAVPAPVPAPASNAVAPAPAAVPAPVAAPASSAPASDAVLAPGAVTDPSGTPAPDAVRDHLTACLGFAADLGIAGVPWRPERLIVERVAGVTTWQTGERVHVIRCRRDVFVLGDDAGAVWRSLVLGRPLPRVLAQAKDTGVADPGPLLAAFLRHGLIRLAWKGGGTVIPSLPLSAPPGPLTPPPSTAQPLLSVHGAAVSGPRAIDLMPLPADRFAAAAMALVWSNVVVENAVEDVTGALRRGQWRVAELTARRAVHAALRGLLSAHGVHPLPADPGLVRRLDLLPPAIRPIGARAGDLLGRGVGSAEQGDTLLAALRAFIGQVRGAVGADSFPLSFDSAHTWRATLQLGYDWLRIGAHLDAQLPIEEARDLLAGHGTAPRPALERHQDP
ncbi:hypothetical protein GCM10010260_38260 [Streptomyces filipinensis]|uniref:Polymerase nucleotidyl transferase domain-containing protein n=1 Tax=Streptomyces filipinensis TaxID=66887 RepID=A0A918IBS9_9ACTN|nr:hypothetical protein GCM10010260_38260 [Streptomyces filipinensis]